MSEAEAGVEQASSAAPEPVPAVAGFGAMLTRAREQAGLSIEAVAARLRLHPRQLSSLESEDLPNLPAAPYVIGFVRNYAREVGLDARALIEDLNSKLGANSQQGQAPDLLGRGGSALPLFDERRWRQFAMTGIVAMLTCAGLIGFWVVRTHGTGSMFAMRDSARPVTTGPATPAPIVPMPGAAQSQAPASAPAESATTNNLLVHPAAPAASTPAVKPPATGTPPAPSPAPAAQSNPRAGGGLVLRFVDRSWVEVSQPDGRVLLSHTGEPGSLELLNVAPPLQLVVGRAEAVQVEYRGQTVDLKPYVSGNGVARLTLADGRISSGGASIR